MGVSCEQVVPRRCSSIEETIGEFQPENHVDILRATKDSFRLFFKLFILTLFFP